MEGKRGTHSMFMDMQRCSSAAFQILVYYVVLNIWRISPLYRQTGPSQLNSLLLQRVTARELESRDPKIPFRMGESEEEKDHDLFASPPPTPSLSWELSATPGLVRFYLGTPHQLQEWHCHP